MDGEDILKDFSGVIAAEIRLPEALNRKLLCPFQYFGITDSIDLSSVEWKNGRYLPSELSRIYTQNDKRVGEIIFNLNKYLRDINEVLLPIVPAELLIRKLKLNTFVTRFN